MPADRQMAKHGVESIFAGNIVVVLQHGQKQALAKTSGADKWTEIYYFNVLADFVDHSQ